MLGSSPSLVTGARCRDTLGTIVPCPMTTVYSHAELITHHNHPVLTFMLTLIFRPSTGASCPICLQMCSVLQHILPKCKLPCLESKTPVLGYETVLFETLLLPANEGAIYPLLNLQLD